MPEPPFQNDMRSQDLPPRPTAHSASAVFAGSGSLIGLLTVTRPEEIPTALAQRQPVLIDIPAVQWGLRRLKTVQGWGGTLGWFIVKVIVTWLIIQWLNAQVPNTGLPFPDWAKLHLETHGDKVIVNPYIPSPHEE
jgi:hypothetical protein